MGSVRSPVVIGSGTPSSRALIGGGAGGGSGARRAGGGGAAMRPRFASAASNSGSNSGRTQDW